MRCTGAMVIVNAAANTIANSESTEIVNQLQIPPPDTQVIPPDMNQTPNMIRLQAFLSSANA